MCMSTYTLSIYNSYIYNIVIYIINSFIYIYVERENMIVIVGLGIRRR
jgi:hypothetical protein